MSAETSHIIQGNIECRIEKLLAEIWFKQVEPLYHSMKENSGIVTFVSEKFSFDSLDVVQRITDQKKRYYKLINDLNALENYPLSSRLQEYIFSISNKLLPPAIKYGYAGEAIELLKIINNKNLVGELAGSEEVRALTEKTVEASVAIYGLRYVKERQIYIKNMARDLINEVSVGKFGELPNLTPSHLRGVFRASTQAAGTKQPASVSVKTQVD